MTHPVTVVHYMYRDASNYKVHGQVRLRGHVDDSDLRDLRASLNDEDGHFIPQQVGLPHLAETEGASGGWVFPGQDDHCWHELDVDEIEVFDAEDPPTETVDEFVRKFVAAGLAGWDEVKYGERFTA